MRCFLSYSISSDISVIKQILTEQGVFFANPLESFEYGNSIANTVKRQIKDCDFIVTVFDYNNTNVAFELGIAYASKKPIFAIIPFPEQPNYNNFLTLATCVYANPTDYDKIKYSLDLFLQKLPNKEKEISSSSIQSRKITGRLLNYDFTHSFHNNLKNVTGLRFEELVGEVLRKSESGIIVENKSKAQDFQSDYSLWIDELNSIIGNPLIIETKSSSNHNTLNHSIRNLSEYLIKFKAKAALLIYNKPEGHSYNDLYSTTPLILSISFQDLLDKLMQKTLGEIIIELRNNIVHKGNY